MAGQQCAWPASTYPLEKEEHQHFYQTCDRPQPFLATSCTLLEGDYLRQCSCPLLDHTAQPELGLPARLGSNQNTAHLLGGTSERV
eukprot:2088199-Amphidinium_carterae.2